jgi:hypothetical protein
MRQQPNRMRLGRGLAGGLEVHRTSVVNAVAASGRVP